MVDSTPYALSVSPLTHFSFKELMALGIVPDDVFNAEIDKYLNGSVVERKYNREGPGKVPETVRSLIGTTAVESGRQAALELAKTFDVSPTTASVYAKGALATRDYHKPVGKLGEHIAKAKERIAVKAGRVARQALDNITEDKLAASSAVELANVAKNAAVVMKEMSPQENAAAQAGPQVQIVLHAPPLVKEEKFDVIDIVSDEK